MIWNPYPKIQPNKTGMYFVYVKYGTNNPEIDIYHWEQGVGITEITNPRNNIIYDSWFIINPINELDFPGKVIAWANYDDSIKIEDIEFPVDV